MDQGTTAAEAPADGSSQPPELRFAFEATPWRSVLKWLADEADLALHMSEAPSGTFTYSDPHTYTPLEAIDRVNLFLVPAGYSVVRSGKLLSVIHMSDSRSLQQLDAMAELVSVEELASLGKYDVVKCVFPLENIEPATAAQELSGLALMTEPIVLPSSNQLVVTDTAAKLRLVNQVLNSLHKPLIEENVVKSFQLQNVDLTQLLAVAGTHLGLEFEQTSNGDINISADGSGRNLIVTGTDESVELLSQLIKAIDQPQAGSNGQALIAARGSGATAGDELQSHRVSGDQLDTVYDVLQTLLANQSIRLSKEPATNSVVALAPPEIHRQIVDTIRELEGERPRFAVIDLKTLDPYFVMTLLSEMFELPGDKDDEELRKKAPKIDADPVNLRLFVRGTPEQVEEIEEFVQQLDGRETERSDTRTIPLFGTKATQALQAAEQAWQGENPLVCLPSTTAVRAQISERVVHQGQGSANCSEPEQRIADNATPAANNEPDSRARHAPKSVPANFVSSPSDLRHKAAPIKGQVTPRGIVIQSDDLQALDRFEERLRTFGASNESPQVQTVVYYLKYSTADDATRLLADLLDGTVSVADSTSTASLVKGYVPSKGNSSYMSTYLRAGEDEAMMVSAGTTTVISDARLNRLICLGTDEDMQLIEQYLQVIDKDKSITDIETRGSSKVIDLQNTRAEEVADAIRDAYVGRIALTSDQQRQAAQQAEARAQSAKADGKKDERQNNMQTSRSREPEMTVAIHEQSNSLIVTAPTPLLAEVEALVRSLDERGASAIEVVSLPNAMFVHEALQQALSEKSRAKSRN